jgi:hypothetical protein
MRITSNASTSAVVELVLRQLHRVETLSANDIRMRRHIAKLCGVEDCCNEATKWVVLNSGTLRLCGDHLEALAPDGDFIRVFASENEPLPFIEIEVGEYACRPDCPVCNA